MAESWGCENTEKAGGKWGVTQAYSMEEGAPEPGLSNTLLLFVSCVVPPVSPRRAGSPRVIFLEKLWDSAQNLELTRSMGSF